MYVDRVQFVERGYHAKFDFDNHKFVELDNGADKIKQTGGYYYAPTYFDVEKYSAYSVYIKHLNKLIAFGHHSKRMKIYTLDMNMDGAQWMESDIK